MKMNNPIPINNLESLKREKDRLHLLIEQKQSVLESRYQFFKTNYKSLLWREVNPFKGKEETIGQIIQIAKTIILPAISGGGKDSIADVGSMLAMKLVRYFKNRKRNKKEADKE
jgi:hypothetical protein